MVYLINGKWNVKMQTSNNICQFVSMAGWFALPFVLFIAQSRDKHHIFYIQCLHAEKPLPNNTSVNIVSKALSEIRFSIEMAILNINIHDSQYFSIIPLGHIYGVVAQHTQYNLLLTADIHEIYNLHAHKYIYMG